jgi:AcrR family transcriptional regulator
MPRVALFDEERILGAAARIVSAKGPSAATMTAIGTALGAPNGSLYHRFKSRDELLGRLWLSKARVFQDAWYAALQEPDGRQAGLLAGLSMPAVVRSDLEGARIMLLHSRDDFLSGDFPSAMKAEAERLGAQVKDGMIQMTTRIFGRNSISAQRATAFATVDLPFSAVRRYVADNCAPPPQVDVLIERAYFAAIDSALAERAG